MTDAVLAPPGLSPILAKKALRATTTGWFVVAAVGHWIFVTYVAAYYGSLVFHNGLPGLGESHLPNGYVAGDFWTNAAVATHILLAVVIIGGGPLQLVPAIRSRFPRFHRGLGRTYVLAAVASSIAGLYMIWTRGTVGDMVNQIAITLNGVLILTFAVIAVRYAVKRNITQHRRWALRLFLVASGVWFFRIGLMGWVLVTGGAGVDFKTFTGPFIYFWSFGQYVVPLAILELYFVAQRSTSSHAHLAMAGGLTMATVATGVGIFGATMGLWLPKM